MKIGSLKFPAFKKIWTVLAPSERKTAFLLLSLMLVGMVLESMGVGLVIPAIVFMMQENIASNYPFLEPVLQFFGNPSPQRLIIIGMLILVATYFIKVLFLTYFVWYQTRFTFGVQARLSQRLFKSYLAQPYCFHLQRNSAQLIRNAFTEIVIFAKNGVAPILLLFSEGFVLVGICTLLLLVEPWGSLVVVAVLGSVSWVFHILTHKRLSRWGKARQYHDGLRIQHLQQGLGGTKEVKLLGREKEFLRQHDVHNVASARVGCYQQTLQQLPRLWLELLAVVGLITLVLTMLAIGTPQRAVLPVLGLFAAAAFRFIPSVNRVLTSIQSLRFGLPVVDVLYKELNECWENEEVQQEESSAESGKASPFRKDICLDHVDYAYPNTEEPSLKNIVIKIGRGESVGIIGSSGAGKSTLVDVILGLLKPSVGMVLVDGEDVQKNLRNWQNQIGYVPQSIYLTDDTLRRNVAFGLPHEEIDEGAVRHAIKAAQLEDFVESLPQGLETIVGERGVRLSGGQRQRIGIARALYHNPAVLVLDEATNALNTATERGVMEAVRSLKGYKTIIIVAHRMSTVKDCDRLFRLEEGWLRTSGVPSEVIMSEDIAIESVCS